MRRIRALPLIDLPRVDPRTFIELNLPLMVVNKQFLSNKAWIFLRDRTTGPIENRIALWSKRNRLIPRRLDINWMGDTDTKNRELLTYFGRLADNNQSVIMLKTSAHSGIFHWSYWGYLKKLLPEASFCLAKIKESPALFLEGDKMVGAIMQVNMKEEDVVWALVRKYLDV